ncbi:hypothetical protein KP509_23G047900 [Ceratopteris richardii]|uniref:Arginyl-tRNA--protein transferase n=1 Tax=Ceratopteris richardii TaxID=49495 RepID=A0A8T2S255_CERRI|nr:hypothetical protein KP509_23G047900 [Ceratopteris richardii]
MAKQDQKTSKLSRIQDLGRYASSCGYCKSSGETSVSYGQWAHSLSVYDYQDLLNRGWRRSGNFLYRPEMERTCCPPYTIRLKVESFCASKEQNRVIRRMQRYLDGVYNGPFPSTRGGSGISAKQNSTEVNDLKSDSSSRMLCHDIARDQTSSVANSFETCNEVDIIREVLSDAVRDAFNSCHESGLLPADLEAPTITVRKVEPRMRKRMKTLADGQVVYSCNIAFLLSALLLKHREIDIVLKALQQDVHFAKQQVDSRNNHEVSSLRLAELLASRLQNEAEICGYKVEACNGHLNFLILDSDRVGIRNRGGKPRSELVNGDAACSGKVVKEKCNEVEEKSISSVLQRGLRPKRVLEIQMKRSAFDPEEFALFKRYQVAIHHDKPEHVKESSYVRFLVSSPLIFVPLESGTDFCGFGSFHQQYIIDGRLVAVGVVDILPTCLSSKYLFWDPDFAFLSLGKYSALREIEWVQSAHAVCPSLQYYYLGYYIHTCPKMRYKGAYRPSELLCPVKYQFC